METRPDHEILPEGESTAQWAIHSPGFFGSIRQILNCARCGEIPRFKRHDEPCRYRGVGKSSFHLLCDDCYDELPE